MRAWVSPEAGVPEGPCISNGVALKDAVLGLSHLRILPEKIIWFPPS